MTSKSRPTDRRNLSLGIWTYAEARAVLPYVASIMGSLREHRLDFLRHRLCAQRLASKPGRPRRDTLIDQEEALREAGRADAEYQKTHAELRSLGIRCLDSVAGLAIFTVYENGYLREYVYDLFDSQPLRFPDEHGPQGPGALTRIARLWQARKQQTNVKRDGRSQLEIDLEMSHGHLVRVRQAGYTKSSNAQSVAGVALDPLTNFHVAGTLLDVPAALPHAGG